MARALLLFLVGAVIGVFCTLLFFRMDKDWKQILLGLGSFVFTGGAAKTVFSYFDISKNDAVVLLLLLLFGLILSVFVSFVTLCTLLKKQTGNNKIRILDIVLGYGEFLKDYYETRKKDIETKINQDELTKRENLLSQKEKYLIELEKRIKRQKEDVLFIDLPEHGEYPLSSRFIQQIPLFVNHVCDFNNHVDKLTEDFCGLFTGEKILDAENLKGYFVGIGMYVANDLFGTTGEEVRTHFRILENNKFVQYAVVLGSRISDDKLSDIPIGKSMITKSFELHKSLVASLNPENNYDTHTKWEDYMTITYYNLEKDGLPFLSMGISIKYAAQFQEMLYFLNFYRIEERLNVYIQRINNVCDIVNTLQ